MNKSIKKLTIPLCLAMILSAMPVYVSAVEAPSVFTPANERVVLSDGEAKDPKINKTLTVSLLTSTFTPVVSDNNVVTANVAITMTSASQLSSTKIYVTSDAGGPIVAERTLTKGSTVYFTVPYNAGKWTFHAKAVGTNGVATFHIQD